MKQVAFNNWPLQDGIKARLAFIGKPYYEDRVLYSELSFCGPDNKYYNIRRPFAELNLFLKDGIYENGQYLPDPSVPEHEFNLCFTKNDAPNAYYKDMKRYPQFSFYQFSVIHNSACYIIPLCELLRAILAPDPVLIDMFSNWERRDGFLQYCINGTELDLQFSADIPVSYVKNQGKIQYLCWLLTTPGMSEMLDEAYHSIKNDEGVHFNWHFERLRFSAQVEQVLNRPDLFAVKRITSVSIDDNGINKIIVHHPLLTSYGEGSTEVHGKTRVRYDPQLILTTSGGSDAATIQEEISTVVNMKFYRCAKVVLVRKPVDSKRSYTDEDENTSRHTVSSVTMQAPYGIGRKARLVNKQEESIDVKDFPHIISCFHYMNLINENLSISYRVIELEQYSLSSSFAKIAGNGVPSKRKCLIANITLPTNRTARLLEMEPEGKCLSTLILLSNSGIDWPSIIEKVLKDTARYHGWPTENLDEYAKQNGFIERRCKHTGANPEHRALVLLNKLLC